MEGIKLQTGSGRRKVTYTRHHHAQKPEAPQDLPGSRFPFDPLAGNPPFGREQSRLSARGRHRRHRRYLRPPHVTANRLGPHVCVCVFLACSTTETPPESPPANLMGWKGRIMDLTAFSVQILSLRHCLMLCAWFAPTDWASRHPGCFISRLSRKPTKQTESTKRSNRPSIYCFGRAIRRRWSGVCLSPACQTHTQAILYY